MGRVFPTQADSASPIDTTMPIKGRGDLVVLDDGTTWLKSGTIEDDPLVYPDASSTSGDLMYAGSTTGTLVRTDGLNWASDICISEDGTRLFIAGSSVGDYVYQYDLSTPFDITTGVQGGSMIHANIDTMDMSPDGTKIFIVGSNSTTQYTMSTPWDLTTATDSGDCNVDIIVEHDTPTITFSVDGRWMYVANQSTDMIYQYSLADRWDITDITQVKSFTLPTSFKINSIRFNPSGIVMYYTNSNDPLIGQFELLNSWDITTAEVLSGSLDISSETTSPACVTLDQSGKYVYVGNKSSPYEILQYEIDDIVGMTVAKADLSSGLPIYLRVK